MVFASERLQDLDRELDALGTVPEQLADLIARYRPGGTGLEEADEALWELQQGVDIPQNETAATAAPQAGAAVAEARAEAEKRQQERAALATMVAQQLTGGEGAEQPAAGESAAAEATEAGQSAAAGEGETQAEPTREASERGVTPKETEAGQSAAAGEGETQAEPILDEVSLFADIESDEDEDDVQQEPVIAQGEERPSEEIDSEFKQVLQLDIDPSVFPASTPPEPMDDDSVDGSDDSEPIEGASDAPEEGVDELDEEFLALLDEDVIELEDE